MQRTATICAVGVWLALAWASARGEDPAPAPPPAPAHTPPLLPVNLPPEPEPVIVQPPAPEPPKPADAPTPESPRGHPDEHPADARPAVWIPEFLGDQAPIGSLLSVPRAAGAGRGVVFVPSARYFKISDDESPAPQTRQYFSFNYFYNLNGVVNDAAGGGIRHTRIHREIWGWEWASPDGASSVGLRLPLNTFNAANDVPGLDGTSTDLGDLTVIFKEVLWKDPCTGSLVSAGLAVTPPTGPSSFAGSNNLAVFHNTSLQPFCGWIWSMDRLYLQGFTAVDAPTDLNDVVMLSNDLAAGYFLYQGHRHDGMTAVIPTVEVHVNTPLNHRGVLGLTDPAGTPDMVDLTGGVQLEYLDHSSMGIAFATPVAGPRLFDFEILAQFRCRY